MGGLLLFQKTNFTKNTNDFVVYLYKLTLFARTQFKPS
jgi:hypothetical protein